MSAILLYIEELSVTVEFDVTGEYNKVQRQILECEPIEAGWEIVDIVWNRFLYNDAENRIVERYLDEVETKFYKQQK